MSGGVGIILPSTSITESETTVVAGVVISFPSSVTRPWDIHRSPSLLEQRPVRASRFAILSDAFNVMSGTQSQMHQIF
jgi:hypothetical protein|tara:strand:+ start:575 stop:808 length:234 start_codon:yes stop_codon:yes gene_type:complete